MGMRAIKEPEGISIDETIENINQVLNDLDESDSVELTAADLVWLRRAKSALNDCKHLGYK